MHCLFSLYHSVYIMSNRFPIIYIYFVLLVWGQHKCIRRNAFVVFKAVYVKAHSHQYLCLSISLSFSLSLCSIYPYMHYIHNIHTTHNRCLYLHPPTNHLSIPTNLHIVALHSIYGYANGAQFQQTLCDSTIYR